MARISREHIGGNKAAIGSLPRHGAVTACRKNYPQPMSVPERPHRRRWIDRGALKRTK
jgi:hypothetical protein